MQSLKTDFYKYISLSILGMLGTSGTILADTFFVSNKLGATGLAALNISISIFGLINGLGMMLGIGGATRYTILKSQGFDRDANRAFSFSLLGAIGIGACFFASGLFFSESITTFLGATSDIFSMCNTYLKTILLFAPFFILNHLFMAFIRNDGNPRLSMCTMVSGSLANIVLDYLFIYPLKMGIFGAALATGLAPVIGLLVSSLHFFTRSNKFHFILCKIDLREFLKIPQLGLSALINELSSSIVLVVFNLLLLKNAGSIGVAAYGIIANLALVVLSVFTGISVGIQPLLSRAYGKGNTAEVQYLYRRGLFLSFLIGVIILGTAFAYAPVLVSWFNSERNAVLQSFAEDGLKLYFIGFLFAGYNYLTAAFFSATEKTTSAFIISLFRGCIGIIAAAYLFAYFFEITGLWIAFPVVELITVIIGFYMHNIHRKNWGSGSEVIETPNV